MCRDIFVLETTSLHNEHCSFSEDLQVSPPSAPDFSLVTLFFDFFVGGILFASLTFLCPLKPTNLPVSLLFSDVFSVGILPLSTPIELLSSSSFISESVFDPFQHFQRDFAVYFSL